MSANGSVLDKMEIMMKKILQTTAIATATVFSLAGASAASTVSSIGDSFTVNYNYLGTLLADLTWTVTGISGSTWSFSVLIDNNSSYDAGTGETNRITSFGFTTDPSATNISVTSAGWDGVVDTSGINGAGYQHFDIEACVYNGSTCTGGGNEGVAGLQSETVDLSFYYGGGSDLEFTSFATRWQSIGEGGDDSMVLGPTTPIPLPAAGWLLLGGVAGLGALARRQKRKAA